MEKTVLSIQLLTIALLVVRMTKLFVPDTLMLLVVRELMNANQKLKTPTETFVQQVLFVTHRVKQMKYLVQEEWI